MFNTDSTFNSNKIASRDRNVLRFSITLTDHWDNTVTPGEELSVNTDRFLRNFGPIHTDGRRPEVCID